MAINPSTNANMVGRHTPPDANYIYGSAKDETAGGANDGSPFFKGRSDDVFGFQQSLLRAAGITPSGTADTALLSEYVQAIVEIAMGRAALFVDSGAADAYVLDPSPNQQKPRSLFDGMRVTFVPGNDNTGASTANVVGIGAKTIANASTGFIKANLRTELLYRSATDDFIIWNTARYVSGDSGFEITNGDIRQWGNTGNLGDTSGQQTITRPFLIPFPSTVDEAQVSTIGLTGAVSPASVLSTWNKGGTTVTDISLTYREVTGDVQNNWAIAWVATGR